MRESRAPRIVLLNKVDRVAKPKLLPIIERYAASQLFEEIVPISAREGDGTDRVLDLIWQRLPVAEPLFDAVVNGLGPQGQHAAFVNDQQR